MARILIIEHDGGLRKILRRLFSSEGYEVDVAPNGAAGLEMLRQRAPSAVILDLPYPESSACDLCRKIVNLIPGLPLLLLGASSDIAGQVLLLESGADGYVTIPFSPKEFVERLRVLMRRASRVNREKPDVFDDRMVDFSGVESARCGEKDMAAV